MTIALVYREQERTVVHIVRESGEGERPAKVGPVTEPAPADIGYVQPASDKMLLVIPGENLIKLHMVFRRASIRLAAAAGKCVQHHNPANARLHAPRQGPFVAGAHSEFTDQTRRQYPAKGNEKVNFVTI